MNRPLVWMMLLALALLAGCRKSSPPAPQDAPAGEVWISQDQFQNAALAVAPAQIRPVDTGVTTTARLIFPDEHVQHVYSPVSGRIVKIEAQVGQRVAKGDVLATIESPDLGIAAADLGKAAADFDAADHDYRRQKELAAIHAAAQRNYEEAEDNFKRAQAELQRAREKAKLLRADGKDAANGTYELRALIDGEVVARNVNPGMEVQGQYSGGTAVELFTVGDIDPLWAIADVFEMDVPRVHAGEAATLTVVAWPGRQFHGKIDWVSDELDPVTRAASARATIPNPDKALKPGMFATMRIDTDGRPGLAVPKTAVVRLGDQTFVFLDRGRAPDGRRRFERRQVTVSGDDSGDYVEVLHGLSPSDPVVTSGAIFLSGAL